jgi:hypothetical protein
MMFMVLWKKLPVEIIRKEDCRKPSQCMIDFFIGRYQAMHGIMRGNEKAGIQVRLNKYAKINQRIGPDDLNLKQQKKGSCPKQDNRRSNNDSLRIDG